MNAGVGYHILLVWMEEISVDLGHFVRSQDPFFFFQAEDGIRDHCVTGVQTCALPISIISTFVRGPGLEASMSRYLIERIAARPNVEMIVDSEVFLLEGKDGILEAARWRHCRSGEETRRNIRHLFLFVGADPNTSWLSHCDVALDNQGFVRTGTELGVHRP